MKKNKTKATVAEQITYTMCGLLLAWCMLSWFDVVSNNMNGANYQWWNLIELVFAAAG